MAKRTVAKVEEPREWLNAFKVEAEADDEEVQVFITDRAGEPYVDAEGEPNFICVLGEYSKVIRSYDLKRHRKAVQAAARGLPEELSDERGAARLAEATTRWRVTIEGKDVPFSKDNARAIYVAAPWILEKVAAAFRNHADFFKVASDS